MDNFFSKGLWGTGENLKHISDPTSATKLVADPTDQGLNVTYIGYGFEVFSGNIPIAGTITSLLFDQGSTRIAEISGIEWEIDPFTSAASNSFTDETALSAFMNSEPVIIDARAATSALNDFQANFTFSSDLTVKGSGFGDSIVGANGNDRIFGNKGNDVISSGSGNDLVKGGRGHDTMYNDLGADTFDGGAGQDTLIDDNALLAVDLGGVFVNLATGAHSFGNFSDQKDTLSNIEHYTYKGVDDVSIIGSDDANTIRTGRGEDFIRGEKGNDLIFAGRGMDVIKGGAGNDRIFAGRGNDNIRAGSGDDVIFAGAGRDRIISGSGEDVFVFNDVALDNRNTITDFEDGMDIIRITKNSGFDAVQIDSTNGGLDTLITLSGGTEIILRDVTSDLIDINDFDLV